MNVQKDIMKKIKFVSNVIHYVKQQEKIVLNVKVA